MRPEGTSADRFDAATAFRALTNPNGPACRVVLDVLAEAAELFTTELSEGALLDTLRERGRGPMGAVGRGSRGMPARRQPACWGSPA